MQQKIETLEAELMGLIAEAGGREALEAARVRALGRRGRITEMLKELGAMAPDERRAMGAALNGVKARIGEAIEARRNILALAALEARLATEEIDLGLPVRAEAEGRIHPVSQVMEEVIAICADMGFEVKEGPDIEDDFHNFTALNIPPEHPARQMHDTFYFPAKADGEAMLLRTHTSPVQIRTMQSSPPPYRIIVPGRTYRCDSDQTHTPMFHQLEGLVVDRETHLGHLKGCLIDFARAFFEVADLPLRFRPSYFPFTEPSAEVDIGCSTKGGEFRIGPGEDWMEILGCGMVHDRVLENCGLDPEQYQGFAFGMGIDRIAMLKYGIRDLRSFFDSDLRWLRHYGFAALDTPTLGQGLSR